MEYVSVVLKVPKEASELIDSVVDIVSAVAKAGADGFGVEDIPALTGAAMKLVAEVSDYEEIVRELQGDPEAAANLAALTGAKVLKALGLV